MGFPTTTESIQHAFNFLTWIGVSRTHIEKDVHGRFHLTHTKGIRRILYGLFHLNSIAKITFLCLLYFGVFGVEFEFLDLMAILLWFLIIAMILISERLFCRSFPFFEIMSAGWRIQNSIFEKLGQPKGMKKNLEHSVQKKIAFQSSIILIGNLAMVVQYQAAPKYCVFTGFLVEADTPLINFLFGLHEIGFIFHAWSLYGSLICISSILGGQLVATLDAMTEEMNILTDALIVRSAHEEKGDVDIRDKPKKSKYTIETLLEDYRNLMIYADQLNSFTAYNFLCVHVTSYLQMISDVFIMIQLLRSGEADFMAVFFFAEDCMVCMYMLFKCFKAISFVSASGQAFVQGFKSYLRLDIKNRVLFSKVLTTLHPVAIKIGPGFVDPSFVGNAMMILLNYYIAVALW